MLYRSSDSGGYINRAPMSLQQFNLNMMIHRSERKQTGFWRAFLEFYAAAIPEWPALPHYISLIGLHRLDIYGFNVHTQWHTVKLLTSYFTVGGARFNCPRNFVHPKPCRHTCHDFQRSSRKAPAACLDAKVVPWDLRMQRIMKMGVDPKHTNHEENDDEPSNLRVPHFR